MIKGKLKTELTMDTVLSKVSEYDIYRLFFGNFDLNQVTCNHLRGDKTPSFIIGNKYGHISHFDFGDKEWRGDAFNLVQQIHRCDLNTALKIIDREFGLGLTNAPVKEYKQITGAYKQPEVTKRNTLIQVISRKFTKEELSYWNEYYQDIQDLLNNNIYSIKTLYFNRQKFPLKDTELRFGYFYPEKQAWKIYFPFKEKKKKWLGNVPLTTHWGTENLKKGHNSLIAKSLKDYMVCKKVTPYVCGVQNESLAAFSEEFVQKVKDNSDTVYYGGDSDKPGKEASYAITQGFGFKHINPEDRLLPECNDFACWGKNEGLKKLEEHFIKKGLIC